MEVLTPRTSGTRVKEASGTGCQVPGAQVHWGRPSLCQLPPRSRSAHLPAGAMGPPGGGNEFLQASLLHTQGTLNIKEDHGPEHVKTGNCQGRTWLTKEPTIYPHEPTLEAHLDVPTIALPSSKMPISSCNCLLGCEPQERSIYGYQISKPATQQGYDRNLSKEQVDGMGLPVHLRSHMSHCLCLLEAERYQTKGASA